MSEADKDRSREARRKLDPYFQLSPCRFCSSGRDDGGDEGDGGDGQENEQKYPRLA